MSLRREDTGLFIYPAFLYFLEEEFFRIYRARGTMSLLIFEIRELVETPEGFKRKPISTEAVADAVMRIFKRKRHTDILGHYEAFDFAAILPGTKPGGASVLRRRSTKVLPNGLWLAWKASVFQWSLVQLEFPKTVLT